MTHRMKIIKIPKDISNIIILSDHHFPNQDNHALYLTEEYAKKEKVEAIVLNGDLGDNTPFGRHGHKPEDEDKISKVFDSQIEYFARLKKKFPNAKKYFTEGNHDAWFKRYIREKARELQRDKYFTLEGRLRLEEFGIEYVTEEKALKFYDYYIAHGHQFFRGKYRGMIAAKGAFDAVMDNIICGHVHTLSHYPKKGIDGINKHGYTSGCLSTLSPSYNTYANYQLGFIHAFRKGTKTVIRNIMIEKEILF